MSARQRDPKVPYNRKNLIKSNQQNHTYPSWRPKQEDGATYGMVWLDIEDNPSEGCSWQDYSGDSNCDYVAELANAVQANGGVVGIYSSQYEWEEVMGSAYTCTGLAGYPLWYAHYDGWASFDDFSEVSFGGWSTPSIKQYYGDDYICSTDVDDNYYP